VISAIKSSHRLIDNTNTAAHTGITIGIWIGISLIFVLAATTFIITIGIMHNINGISTNLREIATGEGELTRRLRTGSQDEIGQLVNYFNTFMDKL
jgi:methyl-accepting chemotaxis protein